MFTGYIEERLESVFTSKFSVSDKQAVYIDFNLNLLIQINNFSRQVFLRQFSRSSLSRSYDARTTPITKQSPSR